MAARPKLPITQVAGVYRGRRTGNAALHTGSRRVGTRVSLNACRKMRYYFDLIENDERSPDEEGVELDSLRDMHEMTARALADLARDAVLEGRARTGWPLVFIVEVRDGNRALFQAHMTLQLGSLQ